jgi:hypothetical protein
MISIDAGASLARCGEPVTLVVTGSPNNCSKAL